MNKEVCIHYVTGAPQQWALNGVATKAREAVLFPFEIK